MSDRELESSGEEITEKVVSSKQKIQPKVEKVKRRRLIPKNTESDDEAPVKKPSDDNSDTDPVAPPKKRKTDSDDEPTIKKMKKTDESTTKKKKKPVNDSLSAEETRVLEVLKKAGDFVPVRKLAKDLELTKKEANQLLYPLLNKKLVKKEAEDDGTKPRWAAV